MIPSTPSLVTIRSRKAPLLIYSITCKKNLSPEHSKNLLNCLCLSVLALQQSSWWLKPPVRIKTFKCEAAPIVVIHLFHLFEWPIADTPYNIIFACHFLDSKPEALHQLQFKPQEKICSQNSLRNKLNKISTVCVYTYIFFFYFDLKRRWLSILSR